MLLGLVWCLVVSNLPPTKARGSVPTTNPNQPRVAQKHQWVRYKHKWVRIIPIRIALLRGRGVWTNGPREASMVLPQCARARMRKRAFISGGQRKKAPLCRWRVSTMRISSIPMAHSNKNNGSRLFVSKLFREAPRNWTGEVPVPKMGLKMRSQLQTSWEDSSGETGKVDRNRKGEKGIGTGEKGKGRRGRRGQQEAHVRIRKTNKNESMGNGAWLISALSAAVTSMPQSRPGRTRIETLLLVDHFEWGNPFKQEGRPGALQSQSGSAFCRLLVLPLGGQPSPGQHPLRWFIHMSRHWRPDFGPGAIGLGGGVLHGIDAGLLVLIRDPQEAWRLGEETTPKWLRKVGQAQHGKGVMYFCLSTPATNSYVGT